MASVAFMRPSDGAALGLSGIGAFGSTFGQSVNVGSYQDSTYETDSLGSAQGKTLSNIKWAHAQSGYVNGANLLNLLAIPNTDATLNIRFTHTSPVSLVNSRLWCTDRSSTTGVPPGITIKIAQLIHSGVSQVANGLGNASWSSPISTGYLSLSNSPGSGLLAITGANAQHDYFIALSISPDSIGSKLSTLRFSTEYL